VPFPQFLKVLQHAVARFNDYDLDASVQFVNTIDGCNPKMGASESAMPTILNVSGRSTSTVNYRLVGNHDQHNMHQQNKLHKIQHFE